MTMVALTVVQSTLSPVSGLKRFLKAQAASSSRSTSAISSTTEKGRLPTHIIYEIGRHSTLRDIAHLSLCSHRIRNLLAPLLYTAVDLKTNRQCRVTLIALSKQPDLAHYVRRLVVRTNNLEWTDPGDKIDEHLISNLIARLAAARSLQALEAFDWDGLEMPSDELWSALRTSCPYLKRISTIIGEEPLNASSPLWDFDDLRQLSIKAKSRSLDWLSEGLPKPEKLPRKFWAMLLERCPRLEDLTLGGPAPSPRLFDVRHVIAGRWPRLRRIIFGDMVLISPERGDAQARETARAFQEFFRVHRTLKHVGMEHAGGSAFWPGGFDWGVAGAMPAMTTLPGYEMEEAILPRLESFSGPLRYVKTLPPRTRKQLKTLRITSLHHNVSAVGPTCNVLRDLNALEELGVWVDLSFGSTGVSGGAKTRRGSLDSMGRSGKGNAGVDGDDAHVLRAMLDACPETLRHLEVACFTRPTFSIKDFSAALSHAPPSLSSFHLTKVHKSGSGDEDLLKSAARLVVENPGLRNVMLRTTQDSWFCGGAASGGSGGRVRSLGVYEVLDTNLQRDYPSSTSSSSCSGSASSPSSSSTPSPSCSVESESILPTLTPTAILLAHEWGQRTLSGKEYSRRVVHRVSEKEAVKARKRRASMTSSSTVPGFSMSSSTTSVGGGGTGGLSPRSSISSASGSAYGYSYRQSGSVSSHGHGHGHTLVRPSSATGFASMSMTMSGSGHVQYGHSQSFASISSLGHGRRFSSDRTVTWADQTRGGGGGGVGQQQYCTLGRHGSGSSGGTATSDASSLGYGHLAYVQGRRGSRELAIDEGFVLV